ncbi:YncE family protein [Pyxidicoccus xibeiensis]|uniref:YncE family protein n=1 Tax=Pyxidicoccus xibeiensis TaxID=2906759 RepID=UPI0020A7DC2A|nr:hypothetical protein [Pyxidicoccus xibeiensis]MCP3138120.1 hypothetical protein [Pyxidicoccus xibeiensis]
MACGSPSDPKNVPETPEVPAAPSEKTHLRATYADGQPVADAAVKLNGAEAGRTDAAGELTLELSSGQHQLELQLGSGDGTFSRVVQTVEKGAEAQEVNVSLPRPVRMLEPREVTTSRVHLAWEKSEDKKFREYKVYASHISPAFDETNGLLIHVGTEVSQTDFLLTERHIGGSPLVRADARLYFRVFVLGEDGTLAGSNVLHVTTPKWANEANFTRAYKLTLERTFAGAWPIAGVAYDGSALWFLYQEFVGGYYTPDKLTLVKRDPDTLAVLAEFAFEDYRVTNGLAWDGTSLWVSFSNDIQQLASFNPVTGARERTFVTTEGTESLAWTGTHLLQSKGYINGRIQRVDLATGGIVGSFANPFTQRGGYRGSGIAYRPGEIWASDMFEPDIVILDDAGVHIGVVADTSNYRHMTFMGQKLVGVTGGSQVHILKVEQ